MRNQTAQKKTRSDSSRLDRFITNHRTLRVLVLIGTILFLIVGIMKYNAYTNKFSLKNYSAVESAVENVMNSIGAEGVEKYEYCRYVAPEKYSSVSLFCGIEMAAYISYDTDSKAVEKARMLEKKVKELGSTFSDIVVFYEDPSDAFAGITVTFAPPLPNEQCNFTIASHERAKNLSSFLPERTENNLIAVVFDCSAESREEYFPVIYRQGE